MSADVLSETARDVLVGIVASENYDTLERAAAGLEIKRSYAALESDLATSEAAREHDIRVLANQALELERLQGIEARAEAAVSNAEAENEQLKATGVDLVCRLVDAEAEVKRLTDMHRQAVAEAAILLVEKVEYKEEVEQLREALNDVVNSQGFDGIYWVNVQCDRGALERARQALAQKDKP